MGLLMDNLIAVGNHKGRLEIYQLSTGNLYTSVAAHEDQIDALQVNDVYICTASFGGRMRVWQLKWGRATCVFDRRLLEPLGCFSVCGDLLVLGDAGEQRLHVLSFATEGKEVLVLEEAPGRVQAVRCADDLVLACTLDAEGNVRLHVYLLHNLDHLGTFKCDDFTKAASLGLIRNDSVLKFVVGGSALGILRLELSASGQEMDERSKRDQGDSEEVAGHNPSRDDSINEGTDSDTQAEETASRSTATDGEVPRYCLTTMRLPPLPKREAAETGGEEEAAPKELGDPRSCEHENESVLPADGGNDTTQHANPGALKADSVKNRSDAEAKTIGPDLGKRPHGGICAGAESAGAEEDCEESDNRKRRKRCEIHGDAALDFSPHKKSKTKPPKKKKRGPSGIMKKECCEIM